VQAKGSSEAGLLKSSDLPRTGFFKYLSNGTAFFHRKEFDRAITEWESAAKLRHETGQVPNHIARAQFRSTLKEVPLVSLLFIISSSAMTGAAVVTSDYAYKEIFFQEGWIVFGRTTRSDERIGGFLVKRGLISPSNLERLAVRAREDGIRLGRYLVMNGLLTDRDLSELLEFQVREILCDLFSWPQGEFFFAQKAVSQEDVVVSYTPLELALLAARRALDFATFKKIVPNDKVIFRVPPDIERARAEIMGKLDANERFVFSLIDGRRNIDQLIRFSGDDEISTINILYNLMLKGLIKKSKDIGTYEDTEYKEISRFLRTFLEISRTLVESLGYELGAQSKEILERVQKNLGKEHAMVLRGIPMDKDMPLDANKVLKNISRHYPDPSDRLVFIDAFYEFIRKVLHEMVAILGKGIAAGVVADIDKIRADIFRFYPDSSLKRTVLGTLDKVVDEFSR